MSVACRTGPALELSITSSMLIERIPSLSQDCPDMMISWAFIRRKVEYLSR
ncbi:hypothetical protein X741_31735 [Mesorhizobium sp. LNHC229A00]|nr:hypothetical protein X741_31735 [Mesorhizobium sp. LNHC229A00]